MHFLVCRSLKHEVRGVSSEIFSSMHPRSSHVGKMHADSLGQLPMTGVGEEERTRQNNAIFKLRARNEVFRLRDEREEKRKRRKIRKSDKKRMFECKECEIPLNIYAR